MKCEITGGECVLQPFKNQIDRIKYLAEFSRNGAIEALTQQGFWQLAIMSDAYIEQARRLQIALNRGACSSCWNKKQ